MSNRIFVTCKNVLYGIKLGKYCLISFYSHNTEDIKMSQHTEGPWELVTDDGVYIRGPLGFDGDPTDHRIIANLWEPGENTEWLGDEDFANYRVMAASAELLEACKDTLLRLQEFRDAIVSKDMIVPLWAVDLIVTVSTAIAKAETLNR
jgi:hypothetical protein